MNNSLNIGSLLIPKNNPFFKNNFAIVVKSNLPYYFTEFNRNENKRFLIRWDGGETSIYAKFYIQKYFEIL